MFLLIPLIYTSYDTTHQPDHRHIICSTTHCQNEAELTMQQPFPGVNRVIYLVGEIPLTYLSLNVDRMLVLMNENTIAVNENEGANVSIVPATEEKNGYYIYFGHKKICGNGPYRNVNLCQFEQVYPRDAIWYIEREPKGYHIQRGNMCMTKMDDEIGFKSKAEWSVQLRRCDKRNPDQVFDFNHIDNLYR